MRVARYLETVQTDLTEMMRAILVDWMVEVQESFELNHETLYLAVRLVDLYLGHAEVNRETLQLIGATAIFMACKFDVSARRKSALAWLVRVRQQLGY